MSRNKEEVPGWCRLSRWSTRDSGSPRTLPFPPDQVRGRALERRGSRTSGCSTTTLRRERGRERESGREVNAVAIPSTSLPVCQHRCNSFSAIATAAPASLVFFSDLFLIDSNWQRCAPGWCRLSRWSTRGSGSPRTLPWASGLNCQHFVS